MTKPGLNDGPGWSLRANFNLSKSCFVDVDCNYKNHKLKLTEREQIVLLLFEVLLVTSGGDPVVKFESGAWL